jgi:hypothetical protein
VEGKKKSENGKGICKMQKGDVKGVEVDQQEKPPLPLLQIFLREQQLFQLQQLSSLKIFSSMAMTYGP